jgi:hypothetical protein
MILNNCKLTHKTFLQKRSNPNKTGQYKPFPDSYRRKKMPKNNPKQKSNPKRTQQKTRRLNKNGYSKQETKEKRAKAL